MMPALTNLQRNRAFPHRKTPPRLAHSGKAASTGSAQYEREWV